jgi:hypothetical protein
MGSPDPPFYDNSPEFFAPQPKGDTVATDEKDDEINAHQHTRVGRTSVSHDPIVHHRVPVFTRQDLGGESTRWEDALRGTLSPVNSPLPQGPSDHALLSSLLLFQ